MTEPLTVNIQGYGEIKVEKPEVYNEETWGDMISDVVAQVMSLTSPGTQRARFHPVLGMGGYDGDHNDAASTGRDPEDASRVNPDG